MGIFQTFQSQQINGNKNGAGFHDENKLSQPETKVNKSENFVFSKFAKNEYIRYSVLLRTTNIFDIRILSTV